jgi:Uma2 family endonuclease
MTLAPPRQRRWTSDEFQKLADAGFFRDQRVELLRGQVIEMAPQRDTDVVAVALAAKAIEKAFGEGYWVRQQAPMHLNKLDVPEPDLAVVRGSERDYLGSGNRVSPLLVVEVSDTSLAYDRGVKLRRYARREVQEYWIVDLVHGKLEVYRQPRATAGKYGFAKSQILTSQQAIAPLAAPRASVAVKDLLP